MKYYEFDQNGLGKYLESDTRQDRKKEERVMEIRSAITRSLITEAVMGGAVVVLCLLLRSSLIYLPMWVSIIWTYLWFITCIRTVFGITGLWKMSIVKEERIQAAFSLWKHGIVHFAILVWMILLDGFYMGEKIFIVYFLIIGFVIAIVSYGLCYMSCSIKRLRWWEFQNYQEEYWKY